MQPIGWIAVYALVLCGLTFGALSLLLGDDETAGPGVEVERGDGAATKGIKAAGGPQDGRRGSGRGTPAGAPAGPESDVTPVADGGAQQIAPDEDQYRGTANLLLDRVGGG